tara:strand:+ start:2453 stop:3697 length:1245 start_codon:yes stop_codon:yes gene_type:complete
LNTPFLPQGRNPFDDPLDRILAEIALSAQLPPSLHRKAGGRYAAVRAHLEVDAAFAEQIEHFYPQGSMAIDATISNRGTDDEYDLDIVSQLGGRFRQMDPLAILVELERALKDYPVKKVVRQSRCVTLYYADSMHLDITPGLRCYGTLDRQSYITHAKGPTSSPDDRFVDMNAFGFAEWYRGRTPLEYRMAKAFHDHWLNLEASTVRADAEVDEVPDQCDFVVKNTATLALQLVKRFRNICYANYDGRIPPSVMLSYYAGMASKSDSTLSEMVIRLANWIIGDIQQASRHGQKLHVANPICENDVFTDRWPGTILQQEEFAGYLTELVTGLEAAKHGNTSADKLMEWLRDRFGDRVVTSAADRMADEIGAGVQSADQRYTRKGGLLLPTAGIVAATASPSIVKAQPHSFYGNRI